MRTDTGGRSRTRLGVRMRRDNVSSEGSLLSHDASNGPVNPCEECQQMASAWGANTLRALRTSYIWVRTTKYEILGQSDFTNADIYTAWGGLCGE